MRHKRGASPKSSRSLKGRGTPNVPDVPKSPKNPRKQITIQRLWRLLEELHHPHRSRTIRELMKELDISRPTFHRYVGILEQAGFEFDKETVNGETRYSLVGPSMPPVMPTLRQLFALRLMRRLLAPLEGTYIIRELDALLPRVERAEGALAVHVPSLQSAVPPNVIDALEQAVRDQRRLSFMYAATRGAPAQRKVDPIRFRISDNQLYLNAFDIDRRAVRTFKVARISSAQVLREKAQPHPEHDDDRAFAHAAKIWEGEPVDVVVRISPSRARFVNEWPLVSSQLIEEQPDGAVLVRASVNGTVEAMRWVLRWGKDALVMEPAELQAKVVEELQGAIAGYSDEHGSKK